MDPAREGVAGPAMPNELDYTAAVYGSLLVTTLIAVQWWNDISPTLLGLSLVVSVGVFWLTHVWAGIINGRIHRSIGRQEAIAIASGEAPMLTAAIVPTIVLGLASLDVFSIDVAVALALAVSLVQLFLWGVAVGRSAHSTWPITLGIAAVDLTLGIAIVVLKILVIH